MKFATFRTRWPVLFFTWKGTLVTGFLWSSTLAIGLFALSCSLALLKRNLTILSFLVLCGEYLTLKLPQFADFMEVESVLDTIYDDEGIEDGQDVEMQDVEEGELLEPISKAESGVSCNVEVNQVSNNRNSRRKKKKKKNKQKTDIDIGPNVTDINRFVLNVCKRLRERKSYLMCTAVGCIDVSALSDLVKEVDAIQACGGQKTADGGHFVMVVAYCGLSKLVTKCLQRDHEKGKKFEKQFKQHHQNKQAHAQQSESSSERRALNTVNQIKPKISNGLELLSHDQNQLEQSSTEEKRTSVHNRIRRPVTYDDLLEGEDPKDG
ncbi:uncharacterized protein LOC142532366 [Primulina tabacum]|uniref:uncharacterized protein LOC142532366 n=1 Tax=Primulina tabacum TaxID=48773 RepID=UPI003F5981CE